MPSAPRLAFNQSANWSFNANIVPHITQFLNKGDTLSLIFCVLNFTHSLWENLANINHMFFNHCFNDPKSSLCKKLCSLNSTLQCMWGFFFDCFKRWKALPRNFARLHNRIFLFFFGKATLIFATGAFHITSISFQAQNIPFDPVNFRCLWVYFNTSSARSHLNFWLRPCPR